MAATEKQWLAYQRKMVAHLATIRKPADKYRIAAEAKLAAMERGEPFIPVKA